MFDPRLIRAEILKLRRRRGLMIWTALLTFGAAGLCFVIGATMHVIDPKGWSPAGGRESFDTAMGVLAMAGAVAGTLVGATAGGADIEAGVFRDLAATGRSRGALLAARVPGAWAILVPAVLAGVLVSAILALALHGAAPVPAGAILAGAAAALVSAMLLSAASIGLAALSGSRGMVIGVVLAFQLGLSPILVDVGIGDGRYAIPSVATARIGGALSHDLPLGAAIAVVIAWAAVTLGAGLWRTRTQEI
jgi:ABC-type transport system involved in multi-copper enzyme maturation permease subunit